MDREDKIKIADAGGLDVTWGKEESVLPPATSWDDKQASEGKDFIAQIQQLEMEMNNPHKKTFRKSTYWNQLKAESDNPKVTILLQEINNRLERLEEKLGRLELLLMQAES